MAHIAIAAVAFLLSRLLVINLKIQRTAYVLDIAAPHLFFNEK